MTLVFQASLIVSLTLANEKCPWTSGEADNLQGVRKAIAGVNSCFARVAGVTKGKILPMLTFLECVSGLDLAACCSQKCEWVFQIFPFLQVIKSITRKFLRVDLILIKLIYNVKVLKSVKLKLTQVFLHIFSRQIV